MASGDGRRHWGTAILATISTLAGAALGVGATLYVNGANNATQRAQEVRDLRRAAYIEYSAASLAFQQESVRFYVDRRRHCAYFFEPAGKRRFCGAFEVTTDLATANDRWIKAYTQVRIYGSDEVVRLEQEITELVAPQIQNIRPWGKVVPALTAAARNVELANRLTGYEAAYDAQVCQELSGGDLTLAQCQQRLSGE